MQVYTPDGRHRGARRRPAPRSLWGIDEVQAARRGETTRRPRGLNGRLYVVAAAPIVRQTGPSAAGRRARLRAARRRRPAAGREPLHRRQGPPGRLHGLERSPPPRTADERSALRHLPARRTSAPAQVFREGDYTSQLIAHRRQGGPHRLAAQGLGAARRRSASALGADQPHHRAGAFVVALRHRARHGLPRVADHQQAAAAARRRRGRASLAATCARRIRVRRHDEIGTLATAFNAMSERVANQVEDLSRKTQTLALEISNLSAFGTTLAQTPDPHAELRRLADMIRDMHEADTASIFLVYEGHVDAGRLQRRPARAGAVARRRRARRRGWWRTTAAWRCATRSTDTHLSDAGARGQPPAQLPRRAAHAPGGRGRRAVRRLRRSRTTSAPRSCRCSRPSAARSPSPCRTPRPTRSSTACTWRRSRPWRRPWRPRTSTRPRTPTRWPPWPSPSAAAWTSSDGGAAHAAVRRRAARHRQDRDPRQHPQQARQADPRGVRDDGAAHGHRRAHHPPHRLPACPSRASSARRTSAGTATATPTGSPARPSRWRRASCSSATPSTP